MRITATEAKNRFGEICAQAKAEPVFVEIAGQVDSVILSVAQYQALKSGQNGGHSDTHNDGDGGAHQAARRIHFEAEFGAWIAAQNEWVEAHGIPGADLRPW